MTAFADEVSDYPVRQIGAKASGTADGEPDPV